MNTTEILSSVDSEIATLQQVRTLLAGDGPTIRRVAKPAKKRAMSAEARERIGAATKARWAAGKMGKQSQSRLKKTKPAKRKRKISPEGRARIAAAQKARWAKQKAAK